MSSQTSTIPMPSKEEYTSVDRVAQIPLVQGFIEAVVNVVNANQYTRYGYTTAKDLSSSAYNYAEPHFAPILVRCDGYANKGIDVAQNQFPSAFTTKPEDLTAYVRDRTQSATDYVAASRKSVSDGVTKTIDERVKTPAVNVAEGVDKRFSVLVDYLDAAVAKTANGKPATPIETQYQYQRAFVLSKNLTGNVAGYSAEQWQQIQAQNALVQKTAATANAITQTAASSLASAHEQVTAISNRMLAELQTFQASTKSLIASLQATASNTVQSSKSQLQTQAATAQQKWTEVHASIAPSIGDLQTILKEDIPIQDKLARLVAQLQDNILPILNGIRSNTASPTQEQKPQMNGVH